MQSGGPYQACAVSSIPEPCRQIHPYFSVLETAQFFHHKDGFAHFVSELEKARENITNPTRNLQNCCDNPALLVEQLAAFIIAVAVLKPMLKVTAYGVFQDHALAQRKVVQHLREVVADEVKVLQLIRDSVVAPCSNALGPLERWTGLRPERQQPDLEQAAADCGVLDRNARTTQRAAADSSDDEADSESDRDADCARACAGPTLLSGDDVSAASQFALDVNTSDATVAERVCVADEVLQALDQTPLLAARYDGPVAPSRHGVLRNECAFELHSTPRAQARVLQQAITELCDAGGPAIIACNQRTDQAASAGSSLGVQLAAPRPPASPATAAAPAAGVDGAARVRRDRE